MNMSQTNLSKLKACQKLAGGKAAGRPPRSASSFCTTLKGWQYAGGARSQFSTVSWTAPAKRSDDGAFAWQDALENVHTLGQSGVALRLPPQSKIAAGSRAVSFQSARFVFRRRFGLSRRDNLKIARRFNAGIEWNCATSPEGTAEATRLFQSSLRDLSAFALPPGVETPGYCRVSLRDKTPA
jgi:hypothetical protein